MKKRIIYLALPVIIIAVLGLRAVQNFFTSFPSSQVVMEQLGPPAVVPPTDDLTLSFFDDSGSMRGYFGRQYIQFLRILKSHIRERGEYEYYAFSDPRRTIEGDVWDVIEDRNFYRQNDTYFDRVLDAISEKVGGEGDTAKTFLIITDGIQDVSLRQDYSRIVDKIANLLDRGLFFQLLAIRLPFEGKKYPEGGGFIPYEGQSPLFCYIFTYQYDFARELQKKLQPLDLSAQFLVFGNRNVHASVKQFMDIEKNGDGSKNSLRRFRDEIPVTYLISRSEASGTVLTRVALDVSDIDLKRDGFQTITPEFCGRCLSTGRSEEVSDSRRSSPHVRVTSLEVSSISPSEESLEIDYSLFFTEWDRDSESIGCDITFCNWLPVEPPLWVHSWSSDCDNRRECYEGRTPFLSSIIDPVLNKSVRKYTLGYLVIRNL